MTARIAADPDVGNTIVPVPTDDDQAHRDCAGQVRQPEPDIRPLGGLAIGLAVVSVCCAVSYFLSPLAYLAAALAVLLGVIARGDERIRTMGTTALIIAVVAIIWTTVVLVLL